MDNPDAVADPSREWWEVTTREAADVFEGIDIRPYSKLWFVKKKVADGATHQREYGRRAFTRLVSAMERKDNCRYMRVIDLGSLQMDGMPREGLERLFGTVLPEHPTLEEIYLPSSVPLEYLMLFTSSVPADPHKTQLQTLHFEGVGTFNDEHACCVAAMIRRNVPLTAMRFRNYLTTTSCSIICQAVACNTKLEDLTIFVFGTNAGTFHKLAASSSLREVFVRIEGECDHSCFSTFARELRTNSTLQQIHLRVGGDDRTGGNGAEAEEIRQSFEETLEFFNFTLEQILPLTETTRGGTLERLIRRNKAIRKKVVELRQCGFKVPQVGLPSLLQSLGSFPDLVYHILRNGNIAPKLTRKRGFPCQLNSLSK